MRQLSTEVVVIGGGLAGFSSAIQAASNGARVLLLEKLPDTGGSSAMSGGILAFAGTDLQAEAGIVDSNDLLFSDLLEVGQQENDEALVKAYVDEQLATYQWLRSLNVQFSSAIEASSGQSVPRSHGVDPADMMRLLANTALLHENIEVMTSVRARRLLRNASTARVEGVSGETPEGELEIRASRGVIIASGGFTRDAELIHRFAPGYGEAMVTGAEENVGDGLKMAWQLGADVRDTAYIKATYGKHPAEDSTLHSCLPIYKGAIAVNQEGKRFVDESLSYKLLGDACINQSYSTSYQILDQAIFELGDKRVRMMDFSRRFEEGLFERGETLEELALRIEVDPQVLFNTVERYNTFVDTGLDGDFGRKHLVHNYGALRKIDKGPFYAYPSGVIIFATYCGIRVDAAMRVIDVFGNAIEGLFAAGEVMGGFHGAAYMTGTGLGKAVVFGRIAAKAVCP